MKKRRTFNILLILICFISAYFVLLLDLAVSNDFSKVYRDELNNLISSIPHLKSIEFRNGRFAVKESGNNFEIYYFLNGKIAFRNKVSKKHFFIFSPINVNGYSALFFQAYGLVLRPYNCLTYAVYPNLKTNSFSFILIEGEDANLKNIDCDREPEIVTSEYQKCAIHNLSNVEIPDFIWHNIFHISPEKGILLNVNGKFPKYYDSLEKKYMELYDTYENDGYGLEKRRQMSMLIKKANQLSKTYSSNERKEQLCDYFTWPIAPNKFSKGHYGRCKDNQDPKGCYWISDKSEDSTIWTRQS